MVANNFIGTTNSNWNTSTNWSTGLVPTAADTNTATFNASSPNCTINTANRVCNNLDFTGYPNTITMTNNLTVSGNLTLIAGLKVSGAATLGVNATGTITTNGFTWPTSLTLSGNSTITLADNLNVSGLLTLGNGSNAVVLSGNTILPTGGVAYGGSTGAISGTTVIKLTTTQSLSAASITTGRITAPIIIAAGTGTITVTAPFYIDFGNLTYTSGIVVTNNTWAQTGAVLSRVFTGM